MKLRWITSTLFFLAGCAFQAAAQNDNYRRCGEYPESNPDLALKYCTAAIQSGNRKLSGPEVPLWEVGSSIWSLPIADG